MEPFVQFRYRKNKKVNLSEMDIFDYMKITRVKNKLELTYFLRRVGITI